MELKPGYKQTEVGVIPEEWEIELVSSLLALPIQNGVFNEPSRKGRGFKLINVIDLYGSFPIDTKDLERFDANRDEFLRFGVKRGDMFFTRSSLTPDGIAKCNVYRGDGNEEVVFDCHIIRVRPDGRKAEPFFLARYCNSRPARSYLVANAKTTTMTTIDQSVIAKLPVPLPPLPEQRAIAEALSDVDGLLGGLDRLIAKKRDLKKAAMQQLLTGQTRLPGFHGEWEVKSLPEVSQFRGGKAHEQYIAEHGRFVCVNSKFISTDGKVRKFATKNFCCAKAKDILMVMSDLPNGKALAKTFVADRDDLYAVNQRVCALTAFDNYCAEFLAYILDRNPYFLKFDDGVSQTHLLNRVFQKCPIFLAPTKAEQTAIAEVLTEMDGELAVLEQRREKTRALKQAMMQELLTGRTRLV